MPHADFDTVLGRQVEVDRALEALVIRPVKIDVLRPFDWEKYLDQQLFEIKENTGNLTPWQEYHVSLHSLVVVEDSWHDDEDENQDKDGQTHNRLPRSVIKKILSTVQSTKVIE